MDSATLERRIRIGEDFLQAVDRPYSALVELGRILKSKIPDQNPYESPYYRVHHSTVNCGMAIGGNAINGDIPLVVLVIESYLERIEAIEGTVEEEYRPSAGFREILDAAREIIQAHPDLFMAPAP